MEEKILILTNLCDAKNGNFPGYEQIDIAKKEKEIIQNII